MTIDGKAAVGRPQEGRRPGVTRLAIAPPPPEPPPEVSTLPERVDEVPAAIAARQRIRMLIDKYDHLIKTATGPDVLQLWFEEGKEELAEIDAAGKKGQDASQALKRKYAARMSQFAAREAGNGIAHLPAAAS